MQNLKPQRVAVFLNVLFGAVVLMSSSTLAADPEFRLLWPDGAPGAKGQADADKPGFWVYPAGEKANGAAVIICPGGGYFLHATDHEGVQPAKFFNRMGVTAFVLRYRLNPYRHPVPLQDAQRAIRLVRANAKEFGVDPARVGIMGFSAGGHLTSTAVTHFDRGDANATDAVDRQSCRPDFGILGYPVVSFVAEYSHRGSAKNLLGDDPTEDQLKELSNDLQVTKETPPVFLFHTSEDTGVPPENSLAFYAACHKAGVPAELHVYQQGPHGVGMAFGHPALQGWIEAAGTWMRQGCLLVSEKRVAVQGIIKSNGEPLSWGSIALVPENPHAPTGWAMVRDGKYSIPANAGPVPGKHRVMVVDMGKVAPGPTVEDRKEIDKGLLTFEIQAGNNVFDLDL